MKILRNITNISSGASFPLVSHSHTGSPHSDTPFLIQSHPPHPTISPPSLPTVSDERGRDTAGDVVSVSVVVRVCVCVRVWSYLWNKILQWPNKGNRIQCFIFCYVWTALQLLSKARIKMSNLTFHVINMYLYVLFNNVLSVLFSYC